MKKIIWNDADVDAAYLMGVINAACHEIDINEPMPSLVVIGKEIDRLKSLGYKRPYEAVIVLREKKLEDDPAIKYPCKSCGMEKEEKDKLIDEIAEYIEKYRYAESMTSHRLARKTLNTILNYQESKTVDSWSCPDCGDSAYNCKCQ